MNKPNHLTYYDRGQQRLTTERIYADAFLFWSYNSRVGRMVTDLLFRHRWVSRLYGWFHKRSWSRRKIKSFAKKMDVNVDEVARPLEDFASFNDFFTRDIDHSKRPVCGDPGVCTSPVDGRAL
ncbi:MAG: phosphatidylserine decarboxylase, partial [Candidatus Krumholzibacteria bacterium]|nr:phosphatidylserine decarboxylase [Candidatus Krumholzibacteria bacterium]